MRAAFRLASEGASPSRIHERHPGRIDRGRRPAANDALMLIIFQCEHCGRRFQADERMRGRRGRCSYCGHVMRIPNVPAGEPVQAARRVEPRHELKHESDAPREPEIAPLFRLTPPEPPPLFVAPVGISVESEPDASPKAPAPSSPINAPRVVIGPHDSVFALKPIGPDSLRQQAREGQSQFELLDEEEPGEAALASPEIQRTVRELAEFEKDPRGYSVERPASWTIPFLWSGRRRTGWLDAREVAQQHQHRAQGAARYRYLGLSDFRPLPDADDLGHRRRTIELRPPWGRDRRPGQLRALLGRLACVLRASLQGWSASGSRVPFPAVYRLLRLDPLEHDEADLARIATSCIPIVLVVLVYAFLPFVNPAADQEKTVAQDRIRQEGARRANRFRPSQTRRRGPAAARAQAETPGRAVKIYLLLLDHERFFFYADVSAALREQGEGPEVNATPRSGLRGWLDARHQKLVAEWRHGESGAIVWVRRAWEWLHSLAHPDEAMLARLRSARAIDLHYPATHSSIQVRKSGATTSRTSGGAICFGLRSTGRWRRRRLPFSGSCPGPI